MNSLHRWTAQALLGAFFIACMLVPAAAQWQVPDHSVPLGRGAGTGFKNAAPGAAGTALVSKGASSDPAFLPVVGSVTPQMFANGATIDDGTTDASVAIQAAIATGKAVYLPEPSVCYKIAHGVTTSAPGQLIFGDGRTKSKICVSTVLPEGGAIIATPGVIPGPELRDFGIEFAQVDTSSRASLINFAPAVFAQCSPRFKITRMRITAAMVGVDMQCNSGGAVIDDLELSALGTGIIIDGSIDTVRIDKLHFWNFGLTANQTTLFATNNSTCTPQTTSGSAGAIGIISKRVDGLELSNALFISGQHICLLNGTGGPGGTTWPLGNTVGLFTNIGFDTYNGVYMDQGAMSGLPAGTVNISSGYFTIGGTNNNSIVLLNGSLTCTSCTFFQGSGVATQPMVLTSGGSLNISGSFFNTQAQNLSAVSTSPAGGAFVSLTGNYFHREPNTAYTTATVRIQASSRGYITNNATSDKGTGAGTFLQIDADGLHSIIGNAPSGWTMSFPTPVLGTYAFNGIGTPCAAVYGCTGIASYAVGDILFANTTTSLSKLAGVATGNALISGGIGVAPAWGKIGLTTHISGVLPEANGGTNQSAYAQGDMLYASAANTLSKLSKATTASRYLANTGAGNNPQWDQVDLTNGVKNMLPVANGGVDQTAWTAYTPTITAATGTFTSVSATGRWQRLSGKSVSVMVTITITTNGTAAAAINFSLPVAVGASSRAIGVGRGIAISGKMITCTVAPGDTTAQTVNYDNSYPGATGEVLVVNMIYEGV